MILSRLYPVVRVLISTALSAMLFASSGTASEAIRFDKAVVEPAACNPNMLSNAGFEQAAPDGVPAEWHWDRRNTDATCTLDTSVAHSGRQSLRLTNGTEFGAHVYGMLWRKQPIALTEGKTYTMSAWVKTDSSGLVALIGGSAWQHRITFTNTHGQWRRVSKTFVADAQDHAFVVRISTESPTTGVWIDDVKVEEGGEPTFDPPEPGGAVQACFSGDESKDATQGDGPFHLVFSITAPRPVKGSLDISMNTGESLRQPIEFAAGGWRVGIVGESNSAGDMDRTLCLRLEESGKELAKAELPLRFYSKTAALKRIAALRELLPGIQADLKAVQSLGQDISYPDLTCTVLENFIGYAEDDVGKGKFKEACEQLGELEAMAARLQTELKEALEGRLKFAPVPRWTGASRPVVRSSSFIAPVRMPGGETVERPVFFTGFGHFGQVVADMEKWPHYGTNIIQIEFGPNSVFPAENVVNDAPMRNMLAILDRAQKAGVAVCLLISPHYFPEWALAKWPHLRSNNAGFLKYCLHAPEGQELLRRFIATAIAPLKDHPALHSICISNEPVNQEPPCEAGKLLWRAWLENRHKDIENLNAICNGTYKTFADVPLPDPCRPRPAPALWMDYVRFNQEFFADWHKRLADAVREAAPGLPVHAKAMNWTMLDSPGVHFGVDATLFGDFSDINGNDAINFYNHGMTPFAQSWMANAMGHDLQRSVLDAPVFNSENHIIVDRETSSIPAEHVRAALWQAAVHGQNATTIWVWERTDDLKSDLAGSIMNRPACTEAACRVNLDLNRAALEMTALQQARPQVLILHGTTPMVWDSQSYDEAMRRVYTALSFTGLKIGFVTERQFESGKTPDAPVLFVPGIVHISAAALAGLKKYAGRVVFVGDGDLLTHDDYGRPRDPGIRADRIPLSGEGGDKGFWRRIASKLHEWNLQPAVKVQGADGQSIWGVEWRSAETPEGLVVNVCNYEKEPVGVALLQQDQAAAAEDVLTGQRVEGALTLQPLEVRLLRLKAN